MRRDLWSALAEDVSYLDRLIPNGNPEPNKAKESEAGRNEHNVWSNSFYDNACSLFKINLVYALEASVLRSLSIFFLLRSFAITFIDETYSQ
jgi:hypothetical protein